MTGPEFLPMLPSLQVTAPEACVQVPALVREALRALIQRESARCLARLGGTEPSLGEIPRRRSETS
jgi:hypothetical protein